MTPKQKAELERLLERIIDEAGAYHWSEARVTKAEVVGFVNQMLHEQASHV